MYKEEMVRKELRLIIRELGLLNYNCLNSGLTLAQAHILSYLKQNGITSYSELIMQLGIDKASLSRILKNMESKNYIKMEKSDVDKRMKCISILPSGVGTIIHGDGEANKFIGEIFKLGQGDISGRLTKSLREFRILSLKNNLIKNKSRIKIEKVPLNYMEDAVKLAIEVFTYEQNIPKELIPINEGLNPIWWCARVGEDIIGVSAAWMEKNKWHWGRFAVDKGLRGIGIGKEIAIYSLNEIFNIGAEEIYLEARDVTLKILEPFGCEVIGEAMDFFGEPVTPAMFKKCSFI